MDYQVLLGLFLGILAYSFLYLAKGIEKYAIEGIKEVQTVKSKSSLVWLLGVSLNAIYMFMQWAALKYAPISLIAPLSGIGLIVLMVFCFYVLKEGIKRIEILGVALIMFGTIVISISDSNNSKVNPDSFNLKSYVLFSAALVICEILAVLISKAKKLKITGMVVSLTAGSFFALETVSKRITAIPDDHIKIIFSILTMFISAIGFFFTQYALVKENANFAVPCFTSASVIFATLIGFVFLGEELSIYSIFGIGLILAGVILMTAFKGVNPSKRIQYKKISYT